MSFQVFQKVEISIRVKEMGTGNRSLQISLVHNGKDFGAPSGDASSEPLLKKAKSR